MYELTFYTRRDDVVAGPLGDDAIRDALRDGRLEYETRVRLAGSELWAPAYVWATFAARRSLPALPVPSRETTTSLPSELASAPTFVRDMLLYCLHEGDHTFGALTGEQIRLGYESGRYRDAIASVLDGGVWFPVADLCARPIQQSSPAMSEPAPALAGITERCPTCLETIAVGADPCPECGEPIVLSLAPSTQRPGSIPDDRPDAGWLAMHWRPLFTVGAMMALVCAGVALRYLAPGRFSPQRATSRPAAVAPQCKPACWSGESCQMGNCVWQAPNDVRHLSQTPELAGPFALPKDASDVLFLDGARFAVALLGGAQVRDVRNGEVLSLVSEAPHTRALHRVGEVVYATSPQRIYVIDPVRTQVVKSIDLGAFVDKLTVGASGRRALVSLPGAHAVAVIATEYHAEIDRIHFGDDLIGPVGTDDSGKRALTATGHVPGHGARDQSGGAVYAFDPSRLASAQDRVRASLLGNPVSVLVRPDGETSYVVARSEHALVPLEWLPSGAVRQLGRIPTCREPEQIELVRRDRRGVLRCDAGRALEIYDLVAGKLLRHVPLPGRAIDLAVSPDGTQAAVAVWADGAGGVALVDLASYETKLVSLSAEPSRVKLSADGSMAIVMSDRAKSAWVLR